MMTPETSWGPQQAKQGFLEPLWVCSRTWMVLQWTLPFHSTERSHLDFVVSARACWVQHCRTLEEGSFEIQIPLQNTCKRYSAQLQRPELSPPPLHGGSFHQRYCKPEFKEEGWFGVKWPSMSFWQNRKSQVWLAPHSWVRAPRDWGIAMTTSARFLCNEVSCQPLGGKDTEPLYFQAGVAAY